MHPAAIVFRRFATASQTGRRIRRARRRGDLALWLDEAALAGWSAPLRITPGGQPRYSDSAIELVLTLRLAFHLAFRQAEGFTRSVLRLLGLELSAPTIRH